MKKLGGKKCQKTMGLLNNRFLHEQTISSSSLNVATLKTSSPAVHLRFFDLSAALNGNFERIGKTVSFQTANQNQIIRYRIGSAVSSLQMHESDTGSASVQVAVMTEKILNLARHHAMHQKDHQTKRGLQMLSARRKKMLSYLKRSNYEEFNRVAVKLNLEKEARQIK